VGEFVVLLNHFWKPAEEWEKSSRAYKRLEHLNEVGEYLEEKRSEAASAKGLRGVHARQERLERVFPPMMIRHKLRPTRTRTTCATSFARSGALVRPVFSSVADDWSGGGSSPARSLAPQEANAHATQKSRAAIVRADALKTSPSSSIAPGAV